MTTDDSKDLKGAIKNERLVSECSKLDPDEDISLAELGAESDFIDWPTYD